jgi:ribonuclease-3
MIKRIRRTAYLVFKNQKTTKINHSKIEKIIQYRFNNINLLYKAFKHRSYLSITKEEAFESNERLEFLGDAILDLAVTDFLYISFPQKSEGELSKIKSVLVSRSVLADIVSDLDLGKYLLMDHGEEKTGGKERASNMANLYEAIIGAIYIDGKLSKAKKFIQDSLLIYTEKLFNDKNYLNYKSILLEFAQGKGLPNPIYHLIDAIGPDHQKHFVIRVQMDHNEYAEGEGKSKKIAEQEAARNLIFKIAPQLIGEKNHIL